MSTTFFYLKLNFIEPLREIRIQVSSVLYGTMLNSEGKISSTWYVFHRHLFSCLSRRYKIFCFHIGVKQMYRRWNNDTPRPPPLMKNSFSPKYLFVIFIESSFTNICFFRKPPNFIVKGFNSVHPDVWFHVWIPGGANLTPPPPIFLFWCKYKVFETILESPWALLQ